MKTDVIEEKKNIFLKRIELMLMLDHANQPTPKVEDVKKEIAEKFKTTPDKVETVYIFTQSGASKSRVKARIWEEGVPLKKVKERKEAPKAEEKPKGEQKTPEKKEGEKK